MITFPCRSRTAIAVVLAWAVIWNRGIATAETNGPAVEKGLILNLDAALQSSLRKAAGIPPIALDGPLDRWIDARDGFSAASQLIRAARPMFREGSGEALIRFDGKDDVLVLSGSKRQTDALTLFILAAPRGNAAPFSSLFSATSTGRNDFEHGLNFDMGPTATRELSVLSVETAGASGFQNFIQPGRNLAAALPFEHFHVFTVRSHVGEKGNELFLDGNWLGNRPRAESALRLEDIAIGARLYSHEPGEPPFVQGFFHGDVAAVLVYDRALDDAERERVERSLFSRTPALNALAAGAEGHALTAVKDPPVVQMLVPGFSVEELPVELRNLTGIRYRHDGKLVALGYDGRIHLVWDSDGDGRQDRSQIFWDKPTLRGPIGMALLGKGDPRGEGVFVSSKGKVSLILDKDRDGVADEELIVATGWKEIPPSVDAVGLAVDPKDGSIYFCLGTENYANGHLVDPKTGVAGYNLNSERGTIQKVSADFKQRETVCTGVRFTCALAFNRHGDLFATEQEGATWLANGNPFDELLHIRQGLHYGFPPRHPKHLPQVWDEPSTFDYAPQHQSTVGMVFNEGVHGGPSFGPARWAGDALICGESRGKLYRTRLVKTPEGYVAQNQLLASLGMLAVDACVSPQGDLLVACHSGPPDWGTGPAGMGKIFRIRHALKEIPQPVLAWSSAPDEFRIAFDRPLEASEWEGARERVRVEAGRFVGAGDRFEVLRPGYQVVRDQMTSPRRWVDVQGLSMTPDRRSLVLKVPRQTEAVPFCITLPVPVSWRAGGALAQVPEMDLAVTLNGVVGETERAGLVVQTVLPHPSLAVARVLTAGSADHEAFFKRADKGEEAARSLRFRGGVNVTNLFVPQVQPGSSLDWDLEKDPFANQRMKVLQTYTGSTSAEILLQPPRVSTVAPLDAVFRGSVDLVEGRMYFALEDRVRPIPLNRLFLPWVSVESLPGRAGAVVARTDVKGDWAVGRKIFFSEAGCASCHTIRGEGIGFGPDLSNLIHRDRESVLVDIIRPSATIHPDQAGTFVKFKDGVEVSGLVNIKDDRIVIRLPANAVIDRPRAEAVQIEPMKQSLMPDNFGQVLSTGQMEDLLTFLLVAPVEAAREKRGVR